MRGISFAIERGELFGLLGPNGAGKTTTIKMLVTLLTPTSGTARVMGHDSSATSGPCDVPLDALPGWLQAISGYVPVTNAIEAARGIVGTPGIDVASRATGRTRLAGARSSRRRAKLGPRLERE